MVYINSKGEVVDDTRSTPTNIFWRFINFFVLFFTSLIGFENRVDKKNDDRDRGGSSRPGGSTGGGGGGFFGGGGNNKPGDDKGTRKFGPRGFKSITDLAPPPPTMGGCSGGSCG